MIGCYVLGNSGNELSMPSAGPPAPMFSYHDITIGAGLSWLSRHIQINLNVSVKSLHCITPCTMQIV